VRQRQSFESSDQFIVRYPHCAAASSVATFTRPSGGRNHFGGTPRREPFEHGAGVNRVRAIVECELHAAFGTTVNERIR